MGYDQTEWIRAHKNVLALPDYGNSNFSPLQNKSSMKMLGRIKHNISWLCPCWLKLQTTDS